MNSWTPVWNKLPDSSVWAESKEVKILFVTMLALKDRDHVVRLNAFELARKSNLTELEVLDALKVLQNPDTKRLEPQEFEGRRIEKVEDGWLLLNGEKYRKKIQEVYRREYKRYKQAEYRADDKDESPSSNGIASTIYDAYPRKVGRPKALASIEKAAEQFGHEFLLEKTKQYAAARTGQNTDFTPHPTTFFNQHRFNDDPSTWKDANQTKPPVENQI